MGIFWTLALRVEQILDYFIDIFVDWFNRHVSMRTQVRIAPHLSTNALGKLVSLLSLGRDLPPQFNTELEVPGLAPGSVRWFSKAHLQQRNDPVVLMLHGGGYGVGLLPTHALQLKEIWDLVNNHRLSIVWLDYTLSPEARLPKQLDEALAVYRELLKTSSNIMLLGDSAGAHLSLCLSRELHRLNLPKPSNVILVSPWCNLLPQYSGSYVEHGARDRLKHSGTCDFGSLVVPLDADVAAQFVDLSNELHWPDYLPTYDHVLVIYGEKEILRDDIERFIASARIEELGGTIRLEPDGRHDSPVTVGCGPLRIQPNFVVQEVVEFIKKQA